MNSGEMTVDDLKHATTDDVARATPEPRWDNRHRPKYLLTIANAQGEEAVPPDEPVFVVRAKDPLAAVMVRQYAHLIRGYVGDDAYHDLMHIYEEMQAFIEATVDPEGKK